MPQEKYTPPGRSSIEHRKGWMRLPPSFPSSTPLLQSLHPPAANHPGAGSWNPGGYDRHAPGQFARPRPFDSAARHRTPPGTHLGSAAGPCPAAARSISRKDATRGGRPHSRIAYHFSPSSGILRAMPEHAGFPHHSNDESAPGHAGRRIDAPVLRCIHAKC